MKTILGLLGYVKVDRVLSSLAGIEEATRQLMEQSATENDKRYWEARTNGIQASISVVKAIKL